MLILLGTIYQVGALCMGLLMCILMNSTNAFHALYGGFSSHRLTRCMHNQRKIT